MPMPNKLPKWLSNFLSVLLQNFLAAILFAVIGVPLIVSWATGTLDILIQTIKLPTPLWATISLLLLCVVYTILKVRKFQNPQQPPIVQEDLHEEFGVYWNSKYKLRCLKCRWPLKCASKGHDPSLFWCSNCNRKFALRDPNGNHLNEAQAIERLRTRANKPASVDYRH